jgi:hypothetical protein
MTVLRWLIGGAILALIAIWLWLLADPIGDRVADDRRPAHCDNMTLCDVAMPPPGELRRDPRPLARGEPDHALIARALGVRAAGSIHLYDRVVDFRGIEETSITDRRATSRLYLVRVAAGREALVMVRDTFTQRRALVIRRGTDLARFRVVTDAATSLNRFALLDPASNMGDTFQLRHTPGSEAFDYGVFAPDSPEIRAQWLESRQSSCGGGPLTAVPEEWRRAYEEECARR